MRQKPENTKAYLASVSPDRRSALKRLRAMIRSILPDAEECISYSMPAFRHGGHVVAGFLATSKGCSYFPFSGTTLATVAADVKGYEQTKSALHFDPKPPLSVTLVRKLLKARIAETESKSTKRATPRAAPRSAPVLLARGADSHTQAQRGQILCHERARRESAPRTSPDRRCEPGAQRDTGAQR
ncbi:MAG: DUF1801 domain-containing protein [Polyangiaceae bacterium]